MGTEQKYLEKDLPDRVAIFDKATKDMVATSTKSYNSKWGHRYDNLYRPAYADRNKIVQIIERGSLAEQQQLSRTYFGRDGFYTRILLFYATVLRYTGLLIPDVSYGQKISSENNKKKYFKAIKYIDKMNLPALMTHWTLTALIDGCYYGIIQKEEKNIFSVMDLPWQYCRTNYKDLQGNDIIEFNLRYFDSIVDEDDRRACLATFPKVISKEYRKLEKGKRTDDWMYIPTDISICFPYLDSGRPFFLNILPAALDYDDVVDVEKEGQLEEIKKIIVQKVPHLTTGELLFEPPEAKVMHEGAAAMLSGNKNVSVLTSYCDVDAIVSRTVDTANNNYIDKMITNIFNKAGVSRELFASVSNLALEYSIKNSIMMIMPLVHKYSLFVTNVINRNFGNGSLNFKYNVLPISIYTEKGYIENSFKLAQSGYSLLLPALGMGLSQSDIMNLKDLENDVLNINDKFKPLESSYTQSSEDKAPRGGQEKENIEKTNKTEANEKTTEKTGVE